MPADSFDPVKHLTKVSGRDYLEVKWRLVWFCDVHPDGSIDTEMIEHSNSQAVFRARVSWPTESGIVVRTGWGSEGTDDFGDYLEKAETKAIGRALAAAGFGTQFCGDYDFGAERQRVVDAPLTPHPQSRQAQITPMVTASDTAFATDKQVKAIFAIGKANGWTPDEIRDVMVENFHKESTKELTIREASALIDMLQNGSPAQPQLIEQ